MPSDLISKERPGQALVEVVIATLIAAMTTMSVFSVVLSATVSQGKADKREAAALILKQAQETLKSYVSVEPLSTNLFPGVSPAKSGSPTGPSGAGKWVYDTSGNWALQGGITHNISGLIPSDSPLVGGSMSYYVTDYDCGFGTGYKACKQVVFTLTYPD